MRVHLPVNFVAALLDRTCLPWAACIILSLLVLVASGCRSEQVSSKQETQRVGVEEFSRLMEQGDSILLDVRTPEEFVAGHIPGARNLDVQSSTFGSEIEKLDPKVTYLVYCRSGHRSQRACELMSADGFTGLFELAPGFNGWKADGKPVE